MTIIDFTAQMALVGVGVVASLVMAAVAIVSCLDDRERTLLQDAARWAVLWAARHGARHNRLPATNTLVDAVSVR